ncbi:MAG TPA: hypothetical protein VFA20_33355 [Myxococcaceae bacterium]|nr:hypothetical protein [Myxococcaceae bacterium]
MPAQDQTGRKVVGAVALGSVLPLALAAVLGALRPDLMMPMLRHVFGYAVTGLVGLLSVAATALYLLASLGFQSRAPRIAITLAGFFLCTLPALLAILFGPIIFAFAFGTLG